MLLSLFLLHQLIGDELLSSSTIGVTKPPATAVCVELRNALYTTSFHHAIFRYIMIDILGDMIQFLATSIKLSKNIWIHKIKTN
jgi:hypothetical protein